MVLLAGASQANASASAYTFTLLDPPLAAGSFANAINNAGQVAGVSSAIGGDPNGPSVGHATLWNGNTATDLGTLQGGSQSTSYNPGMNTFT